MRVLKLRLAALALTSGIVLGGCAYGYDPYGGGYGGVSVGYGNYGYGSGYGYGGYGYGDPYGYGGYGGYGSYYGYGSPFGWYDGFYYPGSGYYVYDRDRHRHVWTDAQRQYWHDKFASIKNGSTATTTTRAVTPRENWSGFNRVRTRGSDSSGTSTIRSHWQGRSSAATTPSSDTTTTRSNGFWRGRGHTRPNDQ